MSDLDLHLGALLLGGRVGADPVEQILIDTFDAGADRALAGTIDQGGQRADAARTSFEQVVRQIDQHPPVLACQYDALLDGQQQLAPFTAILGGVDREFAQPQWCDASSALAEYAVGIGAVAVEAALSQPDTDEDDGDGEFVADVFELVADLNARGPLFEEVQFVDDEQLRFA